MTTYTTAYASALQYSRQSQGVIRMARVQYPDWHPTWKNRGLTFPARLLWRIAAEEEKYPFSGELATVALGGGQTVDLHRLNQHLEEEGHPYAHVIDWSGVPKAVELNPHVLDWLSKNEKAAYLWRRSGPGRDISGRAAVVLHAPRQTGFSKFVKSLKPLGFTEQHVRDALHRIDVGDNFGGALRHNWTDFHETPIGEPIVPMEADFKTGTVNPSTKPLHQLVTDPNSYYHLTPARRYTSTAEGK